MVQAGTKLEEKAKCLVCTWDDEEKCLDCEIKEDLDCRWEQSLLLRFYRGGSIAMVSAAIALVVLGLTYSWIPLIIYGAFWLFFFGFFEIRVLCCHCPYYAEEGKILHCLANHGSPKVWKYHPEPLNLFEKAGFLAGALFFVFFPVVSELLGVLAFWNQEGQQLLVLVLFVLAITSTFGGFYFFYVLKNKICPNCVNFSCPLNSVPKEIVDAYLKKNPVMRKAWEASGYKLD